MKWSGCCSRGAATSAGSSSVAVAPRLLSRDISCKNILICSLQYIFSPTILATRSPILPSLTLPSTTHTLAITQVSISDLKFNDIYLGFKTGSQNSG